MSQSLDDTMMPPPSPVTPTMACYRGTFNSALAAPEGWRPSLVVIQSRFIQRSSLRLRSTRLRPSLYVYIMGNCGENTDSRVGYRFHVSNTCDKSPHNLQSKNVWWPPRLFFVSVFRGFHCHRSWLLVIFELWDDLWSPFLHAKDLISLFSFARNHRKINAGWTGGHVSHELLHLF